MAIHTILLVVDTFLLIVLTSLSAVHTPQVFLTKVASHPVLKEVPELSTFLRAGDDEWALEMARWQVWMAGIDGGCGWST